MDLQFKYIVGKGKQSSAVLKLRGTHHHYVAEKARLLRIARVSSLQQAKEIHQGAT